MGLFNKKGKEKTKFGKFIDKVAKSLPNVATDIFEIATSQNPIGATIGLVKERLLDERDSQDDKGKAVINELIQELRIREMEFEKEVYALEIEDRKSARNMYVQKSELADKVGNNVMLWNLPAIALLLIIEVVCIIYLKDKVGVVAIISGAIGAVIQALITERITVIQFLYGSSKGSKDKQEKLYNQKSWKEKD